MRKGPITAVMFDFDMTLADSGYAVTECTNMFAREKGLREVTREERVSYLGVAMEEEWRAMWGEYDPSWIDYYRANFASLEYGRIRLFDGAKETVAALSEAGIKVGVVTNRQNVEGAIEGTGLRGLFDVAVGLSDVKNAKPHPEPLLTAIARAGGFPGGTLYAGDTKIDMETAVAAGVRGIGMTTGNFGRDALTEAGASWVCSDLREIIGIIDWINGGN
jgi:phosphoglycolate phosphatase